MLKDLFPKFVPILTIAKKIKQEKEYDLIGGWYWVEDSKIADALSEDLDTIRWCLKKMESLDMIKIRKTRTDQRIMIKDIIKTGELLIKGSISLSEMIDNNYQINNHSGVRDNVSGDKNITNIINIYNSQDLTQAVADIQALLEQLDTKHNTNTTAGKMTIATQAIEVIENDADFTNRIISALKYGSISALELLLDHPAASFFIAALEDWQQTKK